MFAFPAFRQTVSLFFCILAITALPADAQQPSRQEDITIFVSNDNALPVKLYFQNRYDEEQIIAYLDAADTIKISGTRFLPLKISFDSKTVIHPLLQGESLYLTCGKNDILPKVEGGNYRGYDTSLIRFCNRMLRAEYEKLNAATAALYGNAGGETGVRVAKIPPNANALYKRLIQQSAKINRLETGILDSLYRKGQLSGPYKWVYLSLFDSRYLNDIVQGYNATHSVEYKDTLRTRHDLFDPHLLTYDAGGYKSAIFSLIINLIEEGKYQAAGSNAITYDFAHAFDNAQHYFDGEMLDYVRFVCLKKISTQNTPIVFQAYRKKFQSGHPDSSYFSYFQNRNLTGDGTKDRFLTLSKDTLSSREVYGDKANIRLYYIDVWATWCAPCIKNIDNFINLHKTLPRLPVGYVMISIDENIDNWKNFARNNKFKQLDGSYLALNARNSQFAKKINLTTIPRYLIVDKTGNVLNPNAPSPDSPQLEKILAGYLKTPAK